MRRVALVVHNVRSAHNAGSLLRTADGLGVEYVYLTGYTPYPAHKYDARLPHLAAKADKRIQKTALGAEKTVRWYYELNIKKIVEKLRAKGYRIVALEQTDKAIDLRAWKPAGKIALIVGSEVGGLDKKILALCDLQLQIPMSGQKESFNVAVAAAIALYHLKNLT